MRTGNYIGHLAKLVRALTVRYGQSSPSIWGSQPAEVILPPPRRTSFEQWDRLNGILCEAQSRSIRITDKQRRAAAQLDSATYGLQKLREEMQPAFHYTLPRPAPEPVAPSAFRASQFRRSLPLAA